MCRLVGALLLSAAILLSSPAANAATGVYGPTAYGARHIAAGDMFVIALQPDGTVLAWGGNNAGQLGNGTLSSSSSPVEVETAPGVALTGVVQVAAGMDHAIALRSNGTVWTWGANGDGQLGDNSIVTRTRAVQARYASDDSVISDAIQVQASDASSHMLRADGTVWSWGWNGFGQLGDNSGTAQHRAVQARYADDTVLSNMVQISASGHSGGALRADGTVWQWGYNSAGRLADGTVVHPRTRAVQTVNGGGGLTDITQISLGDKGGMALKADGTAWAWGDNNAGQLGAAQDLTRAVQMTVTGGAFVTDVVQLAGGFELNGVVRADGSVWMTGANTYGQLADGSNSDRSQLTQATKSGGTAIDGVVELSIGSHHSVMLRADGTVWVSGRAHLGQTGVGGAVPGTDGNRAVQSLFTRSSTRYAQVSTGGGHSVGLRADGTVWAWGNNADGQLGDGSTTTRTAPVRVMITTAPVLPLENIVHVAAGGSHTVAVRADGSVWAWGDNSSGQLGTGNNTDSPLAVRMTRAVPLGNIDLAVHASAGALHSSVMLTGGVVLSTGANADGQLGDGTNTPANRAVASTFTGGAAMTLIKELRSGASRSTFAVDSRGRAWAWGENGSGQLCDSSSSDRNRAVQVLTTGSAILDQVKQATPNSGASSSLLQANGGILSCGANASGQLADGSTTPQTLAVAVATRVGPLALSLVRNLSGGAQHGLASTVNGWVYAWGAGALGQLANGGSPSETRAVQSTYVSTSVIGGIVQVSGAGNSSMALRDDGRVYAWGDNSTYQLGDCTNVSRSRAVQTDVTCTVPDAPTALAQYRADGSTAVAAGAWTTDGVGTNIVLRFSMSDPQASQNLTPWVEVRAGSDPFSATCGQAISNVTFSGNPVLTAGAGAPVMAQVDVNNLTAGTTYRWRACAVEGADLGNWASRGGAPDFGIDTTPAPAVNPLTTPAATTAAAPELTWTTVTDAESGVDYYRVFRGPSTCVGLTQINADDVTTGGAYTDSGVATSGTYCYRVHAVNHAGVEQVTGNSTRLIAFDIDAPNATTPLGGSAASTNSAPALSWASPGDVGPAGIASYSIYRNTTAAVGPWGAAYATTTSLTWTDPSPVAGTTYYYKVQALDAAGNEQATGNAVRTIFYIGPLTINVGTDAPSVNTVPATMLPGVDANAPILVTVTTTSSTGYTLTATDASDDHAMLKAPSDEIEDYATGAPSQWLEGTTAVGGLAGLTVLAVTGGTTTKLPAWGAGTTTTDYVANRYAGVSPAAPATLHTRSSYHAGPDTIDVRYRVNPHADTKAGLYVANLTFTAVANP